MLRALRSIVIATCFVCSLRDGQALAQCQTWDLGFHLPGTDDTINAVIEADLGNGPQLFAGGRFSMAGAVSAATIAMWDGSSWSKLGTGTNGVVNALADFAPSGQRALYVGGSFTQAGSVTIDSLARWDGTGWSNLGSGIGGGAVRTLAVFDDGAGPALFVGGNFTLAGGSFVNRIAKWNGVAWSGVGSGFDASVSSLCVFDDGTGDALYAGGSFTTAGGAAANRIAKWNGSTWSALGPGLNADVATVTTHDDGTGMALYVGGSFTMAGGLFANRVAKWNGSFWTPLGSGMNAAVNTLQSCAAGGGPPMLYAGGLFTTAGINPASMLAAWNGSSWGSVGGGVAGSPNYGTTVTALCTLSTGSTTQLCVGGQFVSAGETGARNVTRWNGSGWDAFPGNGMDDAVRALEVYDIGSGPALYAGGEFRSAGTARARGVARWDGAAWGSLGGDVSGQVKAIRGFDDGSGAALYIGGLFTGVGAVAATNVARWNGSAWSALGAGVNGELRDLAVFDDGSGPALFAAGTFGSAGGSPAQGIAKWTGSAWQSVGGGLVGTANSLLVMTDASGPALFAGGLFSMAGGVPVKNVARWDGATWTALGTELTNAVHDLLEFDDGTGTKLYAAGPFGVLRWSGTAWADPCGGCFGTLGGTVRALRVFNDGTGTTMYAAGLLHIDLSGFYTVARLGSFGWTPISNGFFDDAFAICEFDDGLGQGADLFVGGVTSVGIATPRSSHNIAKYRGCSLQGIPFCFGDDLDPVVNIACPCAPPNTVPDPSAAPGHGCANSLNLDGARLDATGTTVPDTLAFRTHVAPLYVGFAFMVKGNAVTPTGIAASDGIRCANGALLRFGGHMAGTNGSPVGQWTYPNTAQTTPVSTVTSQSLGQSAYYQLFYRNSTPSFCNSATANFSNAYQIVWQ